MIFNNSVVCMVFGRERLWVDNIRNKIEEGSLIICIWCLSEMILVFLICLISMVFKVVN